MWIIGAHVLNNAIGCMRAPIQFACRQVCVCVHQFYIIIGRFVGWSWLVGHWRFTGMCVIVKICSLQINGFKCLRRSLIYNSMFLCDCSGIVTIQRYRFSCVPISKVLLPFWRVYQLTTNNNIKSQCVYP